MHYVGLWGTSFSVRSNTDPLDLPAGKRKIVRITIGESQLSHPPLNCVSLTLNNRSLDPRSRLGHVWGDRPDLYRIRRLGLPFRARYQIQGQKDRHCECGIRQAGTTIGQAGWSLANARHRESG